MTRSTLETSTAATFADTFETWGMAITEINAALPLLSHGRFAEAQASILQALEPCYAAATAWLLLSGLSMVLWCQIVSSTPSNTDHAEIDNGQ
jgi:hypothetical protein